MSARLVWFKSSYSEGGNCVEVALSWQKSSHSDSGGGDCVEVALPWRKSSHSDSEGGDCVEIADCTGAVHVRDSKDRSGPQLVLAPAAWAAFVAHAAREPLA
ncbi:DUF397 domain-containing protein [Streptomyces sp. F63]|uniref:DUF397 domain-containing protein n=1 Tax=Streptomyces sp. F63 TaxID=2824887 RepID=UPI001B381662|nr:DUF397 domain-containing protein [Streptomyces sp. F63]MBQ0986589.1 DUF397 domain-containing protein [Streptomyces sp. F63]